MKRAGAILLCLLGAVLVAFILLRTPDTNPAAMRAKYGGPPSQFVELENGLTVHLRDEGPRGAPAIILLHGSNADLHTWQPWVDGLTEDYRVIRFDQRGHGLTGPAPDGDYSLGSFAGDVAMIAEALELGRFFLGGNSMGGAIAVRYAIDNPGDLEGLVLVDAGGADVAHDGEGNLGFTLARIPGLRNLMLHITPRTLVERSLSQTVSNQDVVTAEAVDRYWELLRYPGNRRATMERFALGWHFFKAEEVSKIEVPTLIMWGEDDALISVDAAYWYANHLPNSVSAIYPDIGHLPQEEAPARSLSDMRDFLETR